MTVPWANLSRISLRLLPFGTPAEIPANLEWHDWQLETEKKVSLNTKESPCIIDREYSVAEVNQY